MSIRALQKQRAIHLYRHSLKTCISWAVDRNLFFKESSRIRAEFERNRLVNEPVQIDRLIFKGEERLKELRHPDPYIVPYYPGGSLYQRNPPFPKQMKQVLDFGREAMH